MADPRRNKTDTPNSWYHVSNRGHSKNLIFRHPADYRMFLEIFRRHLDERPASDERGRRYPHLRGKVAVAAFCLMPNHFHLVVRQFADPTAIERLMRSTMIAYGRYFNQRYGRIGPLCQGRFGSNRIDDTSHLMHECAYTHLNFNDDPNYSHCSHRYFAEPELAPSWLEPRLALDEIGGYERYRQYLDGVIAERRERAAIEADRRALDEHVLALRARERDRLRPAAARNPLP